MKVTDDALLQAVFRQTLKNLPHCAIQRYVGSRVSLADDRQFRSAIRLLAANRKYLQCGLSDSRCLIRLRQLVDSGYLQSDEVRHLAEPGRTFWYWLPELAMKSVWVRARAILADCGLPDSRTPVLMPTAESLADSVAEQLAEEFRLVRRDYGSRSAWIVLRESE